MQSVTPSSESEPSSHPAGGTIVLRNVVKRFHDEGRPAVNGVSLDVAAGEFIVLLGTSGSGKTTLLRMVNRLLEPTSGSIEIDGRPTTDLPPAELRRSIGYVIQQAGLFPHMRVKDNIAVVPKLLKWDRHVIDERVRELLHLVGLPPETYARRYPTQLSGGEQQRVGLARAMAAMPSTLLMDEPFGALDAITRKRLQDELRRIHQAERHTILFVTHDVDEALTMADRIVVMSEGQIEQVGTPLELMSAPASDFVARLVGADDAIRRLNLIPVTRALLAGETSGSNGASVPDTATLRDALNVLVTSDADTLTVAGDSGDPIGRVSIESIREAASAGSQGG